MARAFAHGITQGGLAELAGGEFGSGFAGAFAGSIVGSIQGAGVGRGLFGLPRDKHKIVHRTVAAAVVGGTVSKIGGGKFSNGAITAAMVHLFNAETQVDAEKEEAVAAINEKLEFIETVKEVYTEAYNELLSKGTYTQEWIPGQPFTLPADGVGLNLLAFQKLRDRGIDFIKGGGTLGLEIRINIGDLKGNLTDVITYNAVTIHEFTHRNQIINLARTKGISIDAANNQIIGSLELSYRGEIEAYNREAEYLRRTAEGLRK